MSTDISYVIKYGTHLYNLSAGTLDIQARKTLFMGTKVYEVAVDFVWNKQRHSCSLRVNERSAVSQVPWGHPNHPLIRSVAEILYTTLQALQSKGCEYAVPE